MQLVWYFIVTCGVFAVVVVLLVGIVELFTAFIEWRIRRKYP